MFGELIGINIAEKTRCINLVRGSQPVIERNFAENIHKIRVFGMTHCLNGSRPEWYRDQANTKCGLNIS